MNFTDGTISCSLVVSHRENDSTLKKKAEQLGKILHVPVLAPNHKQQSEYTLLLTRKGMLLQSNTERSCTFFIDFRSPKLLYRLKHGGGINQPLARAVGIKANIRPTILDATAGTGQDSFILAHLGCQMRMIERSPVLAILLQDALERIHTTKIQLIPGNACTIIPQLQPLAETIYLDPMYPHKTKSALNKQDMRVIRTLVGNDTDAAKLLRTALQYAEKRVVVKRPKGARELNNMQPSHTIKMKNSRFDVYMITNKLQCKT